jgi:hypothetical protein
MNQRIRELAEQAGITTNLDTDHFEKDPNKWMDYFAEKFAELIVRECVSTLQGMHLWQSVNNQNYPNTWHDAVDQGIDVIKEHFGVEE